MKLNFKIGAIKDPEVTIKGFKVECELEPSELKELGRLALEQLEDVVDLLEIAQKDKKIKRLKYRILELELKLKNSEENEKDSINSEIQRIKELIEKELIDEDNNKEKQDNNPMGQTDIRSEV